jgi:hypothetical protein
LLDPVTGIVLTKYGSVVGTSAATDPASYSGAGHLTWTTETTAQGTLGNAVIDGLRYSAYWDGTQHGAGPPDATNTTLYPDGTDDPDYQEDLADWRNNFIQYCLVEVKAPVGANSSTYSLLAHPVPFMVTNQATAANAALPVKNAANNAGFTLPLTGGTGRVLLVAVAAVLSVAGVVGVAAMAVRRHRIQRAAAVARAT